MYVSTFLNTYFKGNLKERTWKKTLFIWWTFFVAGWLSSYTVIQLLYCMLDPIIEYILFSLVLQSCIPASYLPTSLLTFLFSCLLWSLDNWSLEKIFDKFQLWLSLTLPKLFCRIYPGRGCLVLPQHSGVNRQVPGQKNGVKVEIYFDLHNCQW